MASYGFQGLQSREDAERRLLAAFDQQQRELAAIRQQRPAEPAPPQQPPGTPFGQTTPAPQQQERKWWEPPPCDTALVNQYLRVNENDEPYWLTGTPEQIRQQGEEYIAWQRQMNARWGRDPGAMLAEYERATASERRKEFEALLAEREQRSQEQQFRDSVTQEYPFLFEVDPFTNKPNVDRPSQLQARLEPFIRQVEAAGVTGLKQTLDYAIMAFERQFGPIQQAAAPATGAPAVPPGLNALQPPPAPQEPTPEQIRQQYMAQSVPPRNGYAPAPPQTTQTIPPFGQRPNANGFDAREATRQAMRMAGLLQ